MENKMKKFCQVIALFIVAMIGFSNTAYAQQTLSVFGNITTPSPFAEIDQAKDQAAASTGYYFMDNNATHEGKWKPGPNPDGSMNRLLPETFEPHLWYRIYPGPRSVPKNEVESGYDPINH
jgi:hypothetical protein